MPSVPDRPAFVQLEPVGQCNLRCKMCPVQFRQDGPPNGPPAFMEWDLFTRIVDELEGVPELHLQGLGEPSMHPRFVDMIRYASSRGMKVTTNSNLTLLNERRAAALVSSGLHTLNVSIDGPDAESYEFIRVRAHFDRVIRNVGLVQAAKGAAGGELPHLVMVAVLMRQNLESLPGLVRLAHELGMESLFVQHLAHDFAEETLPAHYAPMRDFVNEQSLLGADADAILLAFDAARAEAANLGLQLRLPREDFLSKVAVHEGLRCDWPWNSAYISYDGQAMPCCMVATPDRANFGSVRGGVLATWHGDDYDAFRRALASDTPPSICASCAVYNGTF